jgi:hypothetical protein
MIKKSIALGLVLFTAFSTARAGGFRINQNGRILGALPVVTNSILFDTNAADAVVSAMQIFPVTSAYNEIVTNLPLIPNSTAMINQIGSDLGSSRQTLQLFQEMNYVLAPNAQPLLPINFVDYPDQSDLNGGTYPYGAYPIPTNMPVEGWPTQTDGETLPQAQEDYLGLGGDRHSIVVQPGTGYSYETWEALLTGTNWQAANGAIFNLNTNVSRMAGWTSGDAAGLCMFGCLVRFDECERGMVEHACRIVVKRSLYNNYFYPATHYAAPSTNTNTNLPSMGQRLRLKASFVIPANWTTEEKAVLLGLKKYGALVADNGNFFSISIAPDDRWPANAFDDITSVGITNFEVVQSTGPTGGPRSPGAPGANAGPDQTLPAYQAAQLQGYVSFTGALPAIQWSEYSGPGPVTFGNAGITNATATFSTPGTYMLVLSAADGVHAVAYDAATFTVTNAVNLSAARSGMKINLSWTGGSAPYVVQQSTLLPPTAWTGVLTTSVQSVSFPMTNKTAFFRIQAQ